MELVKVAPGRNARCETFTLTAEVTKSLVTCMAILREVFSQPFENDAHDMGRELYVGLVVEQVKGAGLQLELQGGCHTAGLPAPAASKAPRTSPGVRAACRPRSPGPYPGRSAEHSGQSPVFSMGCKPSLPPTTSSHRDNKKSAFMESGFRHRPDQAGCPSG